MKTKANKIFLYIVLILMILLIFGLIVIHISDNVINSHIENESVNIKEFIQSDIELLINENDDKVEIESVFISPKKWLFPLTEMISLPNVDIKIFIKCDESTKHEEKAKYISFAKKSAEKYLISNETFFKNNDVDCIKLFCGTSKELQYSSDSEKCMSLSFYNHTIRLNNEDIPTIEFDSHCVLFTLCSLYRSDLVYFNDCTQITIKDIIDLSANSDFSEFKKLEYVYIIMLEKDEDEIISNLKNTLPVGCSIIFV